MIEELVRLSQDFIRIYNRAYMRYFLKENRLDNRFSLVVGQRGVGKTTAIIQHLLASYQNDPFTDKALYIQADHFLLGGRSLYEIAEEFQHLGGELICLDEIHKYPDWAGQLKSINDTFPRLRIIASGSSALELYRGSHDLSRRAVVYRMNGMSFREFIEMTQDAGFPRFRLDDLLKNHQRISRDIIGVLEKKGKKVLALFREYLEYGYYPYFQEYKNKKLFQITLEQMVHTTLESDLIAIHPSLSGTSVKKIKKLLAIIAASVPFTPDLKNLKTLLDVGDERTLKTYLKYLEDAGIILTISKSGRGLRELEKPEKIYLNNPNLIHAIAGRALAGVGNIRETFFLSMTHALHKVTSHSQADFFLDGKYAFEVGGKNKGPGQIKGAKNAYLAVDNMEIGVGNRIPLWLFGFLY